MGEIPVLFYPLFCHYFLALKMLSAFYLCCILDSSELQTRFFQESKQYNPDQTAPLGAI